MVVTFVVSDSETKLIFSGSSAQTVHAVEIALPAVLRQAAAERVYRDEFFAAARVHFVEPRLLFHEGQQVVHVVRPRERRIVAENVCICPLLFNDVLKAGEKLTRDLLHLVQALVVEHAVDIPRIKAQKYPDTDRNDQHKRRHRNQQRLRTGFSISGFFTRFHSRYSQRISFSDRVLNMIIILDTPRFYKG